MVVGVFQKIATLSVEDLTEYSTVTRHVSAAQRTCLRLRVRMVKRLLRKLDTTSSTDPNRLPARLLK